MIYAKLEVKTNTGFTRRWFKFEAPAIFGKFLLKYYKNKDYEWRELTQGEVDFAIKGMKINFKEIK